MAGVYILGFCSLSLFCDNLNARKGMCVAMLIGFHPSQLPATAPLRHSFRTAVRVPVPPSAVHPHASGAPRPRSGLQKAVQDFRTWGLGDLHLRVLGF